MHNATATELANLLQERGIDSVEKLNDLFTPGHFAIVPMAIMERADLSPNAKLLYAEISGLTKIGGHCFATDGYIAERLGLKAKSIQKHLLELESKGLLSRDTKKTKRGTYRKITLSWSMGGYPQIGVPGTPKETHPVPPNRGTKREINKIEIDKVVSNGEPANNSKAISALIDIFRTINPTISFANKTERTAAESVITGIGEEKALEAAKYAISVQGQRYAPVITTPYQLAAKLGDLRVFYQRRQPKKDSVGSVAVV